MRFSWIEWTHHTFNPWHGCVRVSPACQHCYAEALSKRYGHSVWGVKAPRRFFGDKHWSEPLKWDAAAKAAGERHRVFCASMADVFENRRDLDEHRDRLWKLIEATPNLDWLLLTKRPELIALLAPWTDIWPANVWVGTTVENQKYAEQRLPHLLAIPAVVRFISAEPLLGPVDLGPWAHGLDWVITGGESGAGARPSNPAWFRAVRDTCVTAGIAFHFKQWGDWAPVAGHPDSNARRETLADGTVMIRARKKHAGRLLDGVAWDELPTPRSS